MGSVKGRSGCPANRHGPSRRGGGIAEGRGVGMGGNLVRIAVCAGDHALRGEGPPPTMIPSATAHRLTGPFGAAMLPVTRPLALPARIPGPHGASISYGRCRPVHASDPGNGKGAYAVPLGVPPPPHRRSKPARAPGRRVPRARGGRRARRRDAPTDHTAPGHRSANGGPQSDGHAITRRDAHRWHTRRGRGGGGR